MSGGARKAAPRDKDVVFSEDRHRVLETSFINGTVHHKGEEVRLPVGVKAGGNLELIKAKDAERIGKQKD
jgi:hypothetical protein